MEIIIDKDGKWEVDGNSRRLIEPSDEYKINNPTDKLLNIIRIQRNLLLTECDWTQLSDAPLTAGKKQEWQEYRQALRDLPETVDPYNPVYPVKPE
jgi:uncharacterized protein YjiS (DUF1127 family)